MLTALKSLSLKAAVSIDVRAKGFDSWNDLLETKAVARHSTQEAPLVIYTSGTTGLPKGVAPPTPTSLAHLKQMQEYAASVAQVIRGRNGDVALCSLPFSHGAGPALVRACISAGNRMVFMRRFDPERALQLIERDQISVWIAVPTMLKRIADLPKDVFKKYNVATLRSLQTGAAPVPHSLKRWVIENIGKGVLSEGYGATEVGMIAYLGPDMQERKPGSSGALHKHVEISVRDPDGNVLPGGQVGEFWIRTPIAIRSYLNEPPLDVSTRDADGFFRIGDVGYLDEDGYVYVTDRVKDMIISGGVNIYPAEIETALGKHPAVRDAAVVGIPHEEFGEQVKAFVELKAGQKVTPDELLDFAKDHLASYKRPKSIDIVPELPRNIMGKVLKRELREPYWKGRERRI